MCEATLDITQNVTNSLTNYPLLETRLITMRSQPICFEVVVVVVDVVVVVFIVVVVVVIIVVVIVVVVVILNVDVVV